MDAASIQPAGELLKQQLEFVYSLWQSAELEARSTERYLLVSLGAIYSYLATKEVPHQLLRVAWYTPTLLAIFAATRAIGIVWRQGQALSYLREMESRFPLPNGATGWAHWYLGQFPVLALSAGAFYVLVIALTWLIASRKVGSHRAAGL